jgi:large conductance mechanosensitive channel
MKKFFEEFRAFIAKGNVLDMAVGVIIGGAFKTIVDSLTGDILNPILGLFGGTDLSSIKIHLLGDSYLNIGNFINAIINFLLMALVLFIIVKAFNSTEAKLKALAEKDKEKEPEKPAGPTQEELLTQIRDLLEKQDRK